MSKKNCYHKSFVKNKYPLPKKGCVLYSNAKDSKLVRLVPVVGRDYHAFDDGKCSFSRHYVTTVKNVYSHMYFKKHFKEVYDRWVEDKKEIYWIFANTTDYFVEATNDYDDKEFQYFARTRQGGWFSIGYPDSMVGSRLDIDKRKWKNLMKYIDEWEMSDEDKKYYLELDKNIEKR